MRLLKLVIDNFRSYRDRTEIDFGAGDPSRPAFLIGGMNGAGKTTILESLNIALYGTSSREILEGINRRSLAAGNARVAFDLDFEEDDGTAVSVKRVWDGTVGPGGAAPRDLRESLAVTRGGDTSSLSDPQRWEDYVRTTLPPAITQFFFFDGEKIQELAADERSEMKLKKSLNAALGIELIRQLADDLKQLERNERASGADITDSDIELQRKKIDVAEEKRKRILEDREDAEKELGALEGDLRRAEEQFRDLFGADPVSSKRESELDKDRDKVTAAMATVDRDILQYVSDVMPLALLSPVFPELLAQLDRESSQGDLGALDTVAPQLAERVVAELFQPRTYCCRQELPDTDIAHLVHHAEGIIRDFKPRAHGTGEVLQDLGTTQQAEVRAKLQEALQGRPGLGGLIEERDRLVGRLSELNEELRRTRLRSEDRAEADALREEIEKLSERMGRKKQELEGIQREFTACEEELTGLREELDALYGQHEVSAQARSFVETCRSTSAMLEEYVDALRRAKIEELADNILHMYGKLATKADLIETIAIDPESYEIAIRDIHGDEVQKQSLSAGEKEIFAISLLWGLARTSSLNLPVVVDTPLARLDGEHRDQIVAEYFPSAAEQVVVLSTDTEVDEHYYERLEPHLRHAMRLVFDPVEEMTTTEQGYFWR